MQQFRSAEKLTFPRSGSGAQTPRYLADELAFKKFESGDQIAHGATLDNSIVLLVSGKVMLQTLSSTGHRRFLSRVDANQGSILSFCGPVLGQGTYCELVADTTVRANFFTQESFGHLMQVSGDFRALVFELCCRRFSSLVQDTTELRLRKNEGSRLRQAGHSRSQRCGGGCQKTMGSIDFASRLKPRLH